MRVHPGLWRDGRLAVNLAILCDMTGWAAVLAEPDDTFARGHQYDLLAQWATEEHWAPSCSGWRPPACWPAR